ncbi:hypothetical protein PILCRDRAFT_16744 [Piloderma croceum F 1598]|uniref:Uncharacterized protein n=1 Tax=Piloderma croceum (strain F 1598) TaxID=765440 RepID=A0A0C3EGJ1_PILCF|nr:hypothetical protein PILCRDRAFT_16744 [Piloderma croceum F 1598]
MTPPTPPPTGACHPTTPTHHPPSPVHEAHPKLSHNGSVSGFLPEPSPRLVDCERTTPPPPPPQSSHNGSVSGFFTQTLPPPHGSRTHDPATTTTTSYIPPTHPYPLSPVPASHGAPGTEPQRLGFGVLTRTHPRLAFRECTAHHHLINTTPPPPSATLHLHFRWCTRNRAPLGFRFLAFN